MSKQSAGKWALALLVVLVGSMAHAETYYLDSNYDDSLPHYRTVQEACVTGELESRIDGYRAAETNVNVRYRMASEYIGQDDGLGEFPCRAVIERTYANIWVTVEIVDTLVYGPIGSSEPCNIPGYGDPDTGQCGSSKCTVGTADCCDVCNGSNPIHTASGNKYQRETDYVGAGLFPLRFERTYSSNRTGANQPVPMGTGWTHTYLSRLVAYPSSPGGAIDRVVAYRHDNRVLVFALSGSAWHADPDVRERLAEQADGWQLTTATDEVEAYDAEGRLASITSREGYTQSLSYVDSGNHPRDEVRRVTDPQGRSLAFTYDAAGRLHNLTDPDGQVTSYRYDASNNLAAVTYPAVGSSTVTRTYRYHEAAQTSGASLPHALTGIINENAARYASWGYTAGGRANLSVHGAFNGGTINRTALEFNGNGTTTVTDALGQARTFGFSVSHGVARQASLDEPCNYCGSPPHSRTYDGNGYPASSTDFNDHATQSTFNARGLEERRVEAVGQPEQRSVATVWNNTFHLPQASTVADALGAITAKAAWVYNTRGQPLARCDIDPDLAPSYTCAATGTPPTGVRRWTYTYCNAVNSSCPIIGLLRFVTEPRTDLVQTTSYSYYTSGSAVNCGAPGAACYQVGDLRTIKDALHHVTTYNSYDADGRVTRITDPNRVHTDLTYTPRGWLATRTVGGAKTTLGYDPVGNVTSIKDPNGITLSFTYDIAHRLTDITNVLGEHVHYILDAMGNPIQEQTFRASGLATRTQSRAYDTLNRLTGVIDGLNHTVFNAGGVDSYDGNGNLVHSADGRGMQRQQGFDALNRLVTTLDDNGGTDPATRDSEAVFDYDTLDRLDGVGDPDGLDTLYVYDGLGNRTEVQGPDTGDATDTHDAAGNRLTHTDARGVVSTSTYDALDRLTGATYADSTLNVSRVYDEAAAITGCPSSKPIGRLSRVIEAGVTTTFCYDGRGNVLQKQQATATQTDVTRYSYTAADRLKTVTTPDHTVITYAYNSRGLFGGVTLAPSSASTAAPTVVSSIAWLPFGPISSYKVNGQTVTRRFDANYRLTDLTGPALALHFRRDAMGDIVALGQTHGANPATETYAYDALYRLSAVGGAGTATESYTYNKTGDRLSKTAPGLATGAYLYTSGTHQLASIGNATRTNDANGNTASSVIGGETYGFGYNGRNRMDTATRNGNTVASYTYNAFGQRIGKDATLPQAVTERYAYDEAGHLIGEYGTTNRDYVWLGDIPVAVIDNTINGSVTTSTVNYVTADQLGTPRAVSDGNGAVLWAWAYQGNPFGEQQPTSNGYTLNLRFPGQYFDAETGTNYNLNRTYESATGRYLQSDPTGLNGGISTYAAVSNSPLNRIDPDGLRDIFVGGFGDSSSQIVQTYYATYHQTHPDSAYYQWTQQSAIEQDINSTPAGDPVNLIGHSYGGDTAAAAALNTCSRVNLLITIDPVSRFHYRGMQNIANSVNNWVDVDAEGGSPFQPSNFIAGIGGAWDGAPNGIANTYIQDDLVNHEDFSQMMNASGPGVMSPAQALSRAQQ